MDNDAIAGMIFTLVLILLVGGFNLVYPLRRRFAALLEKRMEGKDAAQPSHADLDAMRQGIADLSSQVDRLADRQDFMEKLLSQRIEPRPLGAVSQHR